MRKVRLTYFSMKLHDFAWVSVVNPLIFGYIRFTFSANSFLVEIRGFLWTNNEILSM